MKQLRDFITKLHVSTNRDYLARMNDDKIGCMKIASQYSEQYWDGDRRFGYGGYKYIPGRWKSVAEQIIKNYNLKNNSKVLDVGCGKGFLLYELKLLIPSLIIKGFDISSYGISNAPELIRDNLFIHNAAKPYPFKNKEFDLIISINALHNLKISELKNAFHECQRVANNGYIAVESYRNEKELFNLQCWALTCKSFFSTDEWLWLFEEFKYTGDYEFIFF
jgi:ubiquinone/menaquinone biosynthesis C-methylase UbiE